MKSVFPKDFLWGASSSAFQIEGGWNEDKKGMTVADFNSFKKSDVQADSKVASDFYHKWKRNESVGRSISERFYGIQKGQQNLWRHFKSDFSYDVSAAEKENRRRTLYLRSWICA